MFDIIGVGDADIDIMLKVDHIPGHDEKVLGQMLGKFPGGMVANYLSAAAAFGAKCGAVVSVGEDDFGRLTLGDLEKRGVDISHSIVRPGEDTYFTVTNLDASGENPCPSARRRRSPPIRRRWTSTIWPWQNTCT